MFLTARRKKKNTNTVQIERVFDLIRSARQITHHTRSPDITFSNSGYSTYKATLLANSPRGWIRNLMANRVRDISGCGRQLTWISPPPPGHNDSNSGENPHNLNDDSRYKIAHRSILIPLSFRNRHITLDRARVPDVPVGDVSPTHPSQLINARSRNEVKKRKQRSNTSVDS